MCPTLKHRLFHSLALREVWRTSPSIEHVQNACQKLAAAHIVHAQLLAGISELPQAPDGETSST